MEMQQLRYVVAVARTGNFSRAAEQCHVSQPSLSQQVLKLEAELGERLFDRLKRVARPTAAGRALLERARRILHEAEAAQREAAEARHGLRGPVTAGALPTLAPYLLPAALAEFTAAFPAVEVVVQEDTTARLLQHTLAHENDFALVSEPVRDDRLAARRLFTEELLLALPPGHPLARRRQVRVADLARERLIVLQAGHCLGDQATRFCERNGWRAPISFRSAQLETIRALVRAGLGIALLPAMAVRAPDVDGVICRPFAPPRPERKITAVWPRQRPPGRAATSLLEMIVRRFAPAPPAAG